MKVGVGDHALVHLVVRSEKHLFIDSSTLRILRGAVEGNGQSDDSYWYNLIGGMDMMLGRFPEQPDPMLLGLESPWKPLPDKACDEILHQYYVQEGGQFRVSMFGDGHGASLLLAAGAASVAIPIAPSEASRTVGEMNALHGICDAAEKSGASPRDTADNVKSTAIALGTMTAAGKAAFDCTAAVLSDGLDVRSTASCTADFVAVATGFANMVSDLEKRAAAAQRERDEHQHDFERCGTPIDGNKVDIDRIERGMRTG